MQKKLTITLEEDIYKSLHLIIDLNNYKIDEEKIKKDAVQQLLSQVKDPKQIFEKDGLFASLKKEIIQQIFNILFI